MTKSINPHFVNTDHGWIFGYSELDKIDTSYYTAFEVYAHDSDINIGDVDPYTGLTYTTAVPASMTHRVRLRATKQFPSEFDVVIDWGDGTIASVVNEDYYSFEFSTTDHESDIHFEHVYSTPGKYIIKVYGKDYFSVGPMKNTTRDEVVSHNLICRVFDVDLPIASHVTNMARFCSTAYRLLKVEVPAYYHFPQIENMSSVFSACYNLKTISGFANRLPVIGTLAGACSECISLTTSDLMIPCISTRGSVSQMYANCNSFATSLETLFHPAGICQPILDVTKLFKNCRRANDTDFTKLGNLLWNNTKVEFSNTTNVFDGLPEEQQSQIPNTWWKPI